MLNDAFVLEEKIKEEPKPVKPEGENWFQRHLQALKDKRERKRRAEERENKKINPSVERI